MTAIPGLGPLESAIMTVVWETRQPLTVGAVRQRLDYRTHKGEIPEYTTVQTIMAILCGKRLLTRGKRGGRDTRAWWYEANVTRASYLAAVILHVLDSSPDPADVLVRVLDRRRGIRLRAEHARMLDHLSV
jgi:predicted transcriptional regulator